MKVYYSLTPFGNKSGTASPVSALLHLCISFSCTDSACVINTIAFAQSPLQKKNAQQKTDDRQQTSFTKDESIFAKKIETELDAYFNQAAFQFALPCDFQRGTPFQQRVWQALTTIPSGEVKTYGELAKQLNSSARAVGNACRRNLFPVIVPCHRVISASGVGGYAGDTLAKQKGQINFLQVKQWLLAHEAK